MKICLLYDNKFPYTTGFYCEKALKKLGHDVVYFNPVTSKIGYPKSDLYFNVDDDSPYFLPDNIHPNVYWVSDTHRPIQWRFDKCKRADILFVAQKQALEQFPNAYWLPHACDEDYHFCQKMEKIYDVGFVGNVTSRFHQKRKRMLEALEKTNFNLKICSGVFLNKMAEIYAQSKIVFNCSLNNDINMRLFEGMCSGSSVITDVIPTLYELIDKNVLVGYVDENDMINKINELMANHETMDIIAGNGQKHVLEKHTYVHRMKDMLSVIEKKL